MGVCVYKANWGNLAMLPSPKIHLLCDSNDPFRTTLTDAARSTGWSIDVHATADEYLAKMRLEHHGALLVSPGIHGAEPAMEMIRELRERRVNVPILLVVSDDEPHALEVAAVHSGAHDVIRTPTTEEQVRVQIARALEFDRHSAGQPGVVRSRLATLSPKEREVMDLTLQGQSTNAMASTLGVVYQTINKHRARIRLKMRAKCEITLLNQLNGQAPLPSELGYTSPQASTPMPQPSAIAPPAHMPSTPTSSSSNYSAF